MQKSFNKLFLFLMTVALIAVAALTGCEKAGQSPPPDTSSDSMMSDYGDLDAADIGEGNTAFAFEVTDDTGAVTKFTVHTDEKTVGAALLEAGLIEGDESEFGLYVSTVNGLKADYSADNAYWAFYLDGEYATEGVDATAIEAGKTYAFVYTKS